MDFRRIRRSVGLLAVGFAITGSMGGCYVTNENFVTFLQSAGDAVIAGVSESLFGDIGTDFDAVIREPATELAQSAWGNYVSYNIPQDLPNNTVVLR
ncbi:MAG: hypothetical protein AB1716_16635 [Planctomycetota bacterium]